MVYYCINYRLYLTKRYRRKFKNIQLNNTDSKRDKEKSIKAREGTQAPILITLSLSRA